MVPNIIVPLPLQEPVFVPRPGGTHEDDGWVMVVILDVSIMRSKLAILDASNIPAGPVATIHLPHHIPSGLHGGFTTDVLGWSEENETTYDIRQGV